MQYSPCLNTEPNGVGYTHEPNTNSGLADRVIQQRTVDQILGGQPIDMFGNYIDEDLL